MKGETLDSVDEYDSKSPRLREIFNEKLDNDNEKSYRWPKLFIEALTALGKIN